MAYKYFKFEVLLLFLFCVCDSESGRSHVGGRRGGHPTARTTPRTQTYQHQTNGNPSYNTKPPVGFENVQNRVPQNNQPHYPTNNNPVGNGNPSYNTKSPIGFENVQNRVPQTNQPAPGNTGHPSAPQHNQGPIGFENVQNRVPQHNQGGYGHQSQYPAGHNPGYHYQPNAPYNGYHPPSTYYNPHYNNPGGVPPQIYQPVQQSSGGSLLGYAGSFAGGYLIGKLTSGGFHSNNNNNNNGNNNGQYTVHHYYHNADTVPKNITVVSNNVELCSQNITQGLCVPNTFPMCLANGTILCLTDSMYTAPCGNSSMKCVVTVLPCANGTSCNNGNLTTTAVYIPCISNLTVYQQNLVNYTSDSSSINQTVYIKKIDYCVTAIAEPNKIASPVSSYIEFLKQLAMMAYQTAKNNGTTNSTVIVVSGEKNKTEVTTLLPNINNTNNTNKPEITTLPYNT